MDDAPLFQDLDEQERTYAPQQLPPEEQDRVRADEGMTYMPPNEPTSAAPVANLGNAPSAAMAPPDDVDDHQGAPNSEAGDPVDSDSR
jgi:hypothetical protein